MAKVNKEKVKEFRRFINNHAEGLHSDMLQLIDNTEPDTDVATEVLNMFREYKQWVELKNFLWDYQT
jgi:hypothetical protein